MDGKEGMKQPPKGSLDRTLDIDQLKRLQGAFLKRTGPQCGWFTSNEEAYVGLDEAQFIKTMKSVFGSQGLKDSDLRVLFMRVDAKATGYVQWNDLSNFLLLNKPREMSAIESGRLFEEDCFEGRNTKWDEHRRGISKVVVHPRLPRYYTAGEDGMVKAWNAATLKHEATVLTGRSWLTDLHFVTPNTTSATLSLDFLVTSSIDRVISVFDGNTGDLLHSYRGKRKFLRRDLRREVIYHAPQRPNQGGGGATSLTGQRGLLLAGEERKAIEVTQLEHLAHSPTALGSFYTDPQTPQLIVGTEDGMLMQYDVFRDHTGEVPSVPCGNTTSEGGVVRPGWPSGHIGGITRLEVILPLESIVTSGVDTTLRIVNLDRGCVLRTLGVPQNPSTDSLCVFMDKGRDSGHRKAVHTFAWNDDLRILASCGAERDVLLWNPYIAKPVNRLQGFRSPLVDVVFNVSDGQLLTLSLDKVIRVWDVRTWQCVQTIKDKIKHFPEDRLGVMVFDAKRSSIVTGSRTLQVRTMSRTREFHPGYYGHRIFITAVAFATAFGQIVTADTSNIFVWDFESQLPIIHWGVSSVTNLALDRQQRRLLVGTQTGELQVWNYANAQLLKVFTAPHGAGEVGPVFHAIQERPVRMALFAAVNGNRCISLYEDAHDLPQQNCVKHLDMQDFGGVYSSLFVPPSTLLLGTGCGSVAVVFLDQISRPVLLPKKGWEGWVGILDGPLQETMPPCVAKALGLAEVPAQSVDSYIEDMCLLTRSHDVAITSRGDGMVSFWSCPTDQGDTRGEIFRFMASHRKGDGVNTLCLDTAQAHLFTGDVSGYLHVYDISRVEKSPREISPSQISKVRGFRVTDKAITSLIHVEKDGGTLLLAAGCSLLMVSVEGNVLSQLGLPSNSALPKPPSPSSAAIAAHVAQRKWALLRIVAEQGSVTRSTVLSEVGDNPLFDTCSEEEIADLLDALVKTCVNDVPLVVLQDGEYCASDHLLRLGAEPAAGFIAASHHHLFPREAASARSSIAFPEGASHKGISGRIIPQKPHTAPTRYRVRSIPSRGLEPLGGDTARRKGDYSTSPPRRGIGSPSPLLRSSPRVRGSVLSSARSSLSVGDERYTWTPRTDDGAMEFCPVIEGCLTDTWPPATPEPEVQVVKRRVVYQYPPPEPPAKPPPAPSMPTHFGRFDLLSGAEWVAPNDDVERVFEEVVPPPEPPIFWLSETTQFESRCPRFVTSDVTENTQHGVVSDPTFFPRLCGVAVLPLVAIVSVEADRVPSPNHTGSAASTAAAPPHRPAAAAAANPVPRVQAEQPKSVTPPLDTEQSEARPVKRLEEGGQKSMEALVEEGRKWFLEARSAHPPSKSRHRKYDVSTTPIRVLTNLRLLKPRILPKFLMKRRPVDTTSSSSFQLVGPI
eukprot:Sspe_Gene.44261::Locus_21689_Transcript_1_1_Confidence_1.000_Length_4392::g.44261::m.44261